MFESRVFVFKEIKLFDQLFFQHFRLGQEDEDLIVPDRVLGYEEHLDLLNFD